MKRLAILLLAMALAACAAAPKAAPTTGIARAPVVAPVGLERVLGQSARALTTLFGTPAQDFAEGGARKLQFEGSACVLDAYLYARKAGGEPVVTHVDARRPEGEDADRVACVAALALKSPKL